MFAFLAASLACQVDAPRRDAIPASGDTVPSSEGTPPGADRTGAAPPVDEARTPDAPSTWAYVCPDGLRFTVHYRAEAATVTLPARQLGLPHVPGASGARYQAGDSTFWDRGGEAVLEIGAERHGDCRGERAVSPEDAARRLGFDFRALGQEPGWLVDVDADREIRWVGQYGEVRFATPAPRTVAWSEGRVVWRAETDAHRITVEALAEPCRDAMSGQPFSHTVRVTVDGEELAGCGAWLDDGPR